MNREIRRRELKKKEKSRRVFKGSHYHALGHPQARSTSVIVRQKRVG